jgi:hypothetical protein
VGWATTGHACSAASRGEGFSFFLPHQLHFSKGSRACHLSLLTMDGPSNDPFFPPWLNGWDANEGALGSIWIHGVFIKTSF